MSNSNTEGGILLTFQATRKCVDESLTKALCVGTSKLNNYLGWALPACMILLFRARRIFSVFRPRQETVRRLGWVQSVERGTHSMEGVGVWRSFIKEGFKIGGGLVK